MKTHLSGSRWLILLLSLAACKKHTTPNNPVDGKYPVKTDSIYNPVDPAVPATIGFFADGWVGRSFATPAGDVAGSPATAVASDSLTIDVNKVLVKTSPYLFGNNSNLWSGQMVTQPVLMQYLEDLSPNIVRGPGGSISDVYFWNGTDAHPKPDDAPDNLMNADGASSSIGSWYGGNTAGWTFSLQHYYELLSQTNSTGIITVNYGYARYGTGPNPVAAAAHLAADWVRYDNGRTKYWEIGNESYGSWEAGYRINTSKNQDGQPEMITGSVYGAHVKVFADSMRAAARETGATIYIGATLYEHPPASYDYASIQSWNQGVLGNAGAAADYFIVHNYFTAFNTNSSAKDILATGTAVPSSVASYVQQQITGAGLPMKPIAMTEWNIQATGSKQNTSYVAGMHAALTLGSFIKNKFGEASRWDLANGYSNGDDQGMFNNGDEPQAPLWNPRPAFYYMYYFQKYFGDRMVADTLRKALNNGDITTYSSTFSSGQAGTIIINSGAFNHVVSVDFQHFPAGSKYYWYALTGGTDAPFSGAVYVNGKGPASATGGPLEYATIKPYSAPLTGSIKVSVPAMSVIYLVADKK
ncbi:alpha-L-arabinofuranosidase [Flavitalea sp. BT771]|uniref:alpha-L-arabinofuranosidase n=1 Tax=Flavitalea sp. BT771 TaxID=3063329 RepID=UPI0026E3EA3F|nr:alpha-L-arabinofuranosidase [Flavitalea sp. BT771]MDO6432529.1 alpha-L-arabinofuranosidase [Flavitalea sp. BT771]MDV6221438.1 alpha-L-arabinofuranosidase [Flavitalea sp. BT771]